MRNISENEWKRYVERLRKIDQAAADRMQKWIDAHGTEDTDGLIDYAFGTATKYGEASAALACEMYDAVAEAQGARVPPAEPAETATYDETAKAVRGTLKNLLSTVPATVGRLVKQAGVDTTLKNARRDGAEFAWVPSGDSCAFCITLASRGWQKQSKKSAKSHAEHIHANCDCQYAVRFDGESTIAGYDPDRYLDMYYAAGGSDSDERIRNLRRELEAPRREEINAQKRAAYARRKEQESDISDAARRLAKSIASGKHVGGFEHLPETLRNDFLNGLVSANPDARKALENIYKTADYTVVRGKHSYYRQGLSEHVAIGDRAKDDTLAHELFHKMDRGHQISENLSDALKQDYMALSAVSNGDIKSYIMAKHPEAFELTISGNYVFKEQYRGISDILSGLSEGTVKYGYGHDPEYWKRPKSKEAESWAQFGRIQYQNIPEVQKLFSEIFPEFANSAIIALKGVI